MHKLNVLNIRISKSINLPKNKFILIYIINTIYFVQRIIRHEHVISHLL